MVRKENITVVLVNPQGARNIGAIARVMMNFGFRDLRLVSPRCDHLVKEARDMAVNAEPLLMAAQIHNDLDSAIANANLVLGTTRRLGKYRQELLLPREIGSHVDNLEAGARVCLLFGREDKGLTTSELDRCNFSITIPTDPGLPSMNIAHSVAVCLYELHAAGTRDTGDSRQSRKLASAHNLELMYQNMRGTLTDIGFLLEENPDHILRSFRRLFSRAELSDHEVNILHGLWRKIAWLHGEYERIRKEMTSSS